MFGRGRFCDISSIAVAVENEHLLLELRCRRRYLLTRCDVFGSRVCRENVFQEYVVLFCL